MDAIANRRFRLDGKTYQKGDKLTLSDDQFAGFEGAGMVHRPRVRKPAPKQAKPD